jgi:hypothetical protein
MHPHYQSEALRRRICEFLGGRTPETATAVYIAGEDDAQEIRYTPRPVSDLPACFDEGLDITRSLWDRDGLIADIDLDYMNADFPGEPFVHPQRIFELLEPVSATVDQFLAQFRIRPIRQLGGCGEHFVWRIAEGSGAFEELRRLGHVPPSLRGKYAEPHPPLEEAVPQSLAEAYAGLGLVMEHVAVEVLQRGRPVATIPLEVTEVETVEENAGRELLCLDLSEYGDPIYLRTIRVPFSRYLKPHQRAESVGAEILRELPPLQTVPLDGNSLLEGVEAMRDPFKGEALAESTHTRIPEMSEGTAQLLTAYRGSSLADFHAWFYRTEPHPPAKWPATYDAIDLQALPACAAHLLTHPNDRLLRPVGIRHLTRVLMALNWHPRHIAGLVRSRYERDHGWGDLWFTYDATSRAEFYVRLFAGHIVVGADDLHDFTCKAVRRLGFCPAGADCTADLDRLRAILQKRQET